MPFEILLLYAAFRDGDAAPSAAATSLPLSTIVRPTVAAAEESESMATEPAEPVSAHPSPAGRPTSLGGPGVEGPEDSSLVGVSALGYPSGQAGPSEISVCSDVQVLPYSLAIGIAETRIQLRRRLLLLCGSRLSPPPRRLPLEALHFTKIQN